MKRQARGPLGCALSCVAVLAAALLQSIGPAQAAGSSDARLGLTSCRLPGVEHEAWCGQLRRLLDPAVPLGTAFDLHFAVLPALARNRKPDPVFFFAGGPGQSAVDLAPQISRLMSRLGNRRDVVLVDQRGTGRSAPLACEPLPAALPLAQALDNAWQLQRLADCRNALQALPHGDLRFYATSLAVQDVDAVRRALGATRINLVGGSYGTRVALEYMRQFPPQVRRAVIDGVAPPDMVLPAAFSADNQAALQAVLQACAAEPRCASRYPRLQADWQALLLGLPMTVTAAHPLTGQPQRFELTRQNLLGLVRAPLYVPALAAALPMALHEAAAGRLEPLLGLSSALGGSRSRRPGQLFEGMHFAVVCSEDVPRLALSADAPGADFGSLFAQQYQQVCQGWPRAEVPAGFYEVPPAPAAVLVLSGGADPVTPPRHGQRVTQALGTKARHVVVDQAGHGVMALPCLRDVLFRFIDAASDEEALRVDAGCAAQLPRPPVYLPITGSADTLKGAVSAR